MYEDWLDITRLGTDGAPSGVINYNISAPGDLIRNTTPLAGPTGRVVVAEQRFYGLFGSSARIP